MRGRREVSLTTPPLDHSPDQRTPDMVRNPAAAAAMEQGGRQQFEAMRLPGTAWARAIAAASGQGDAERVRHGEAHLYILGRTRSGKSTLLQALMQAFNSHGAPANAASSPPPKPSAPLEYSFWRKPVPRSGSSRGSCGTEELLIHCWEIGGGKQLAAALAAPSSTLFLGPRSLATAHAVIVLDLSAPASVVPNVVQWLELVSARLAASSAAYERRGLQLPAQLRARQRASLLGPGHADAGSDVNCSGVGLAIIATKWDVFADSAEPEAQRVLAGALRWHAHAHAAHLVYVGDLGGAKSGCSSAATRSACRSAVDACGSLLAQAILGGPTKQQQHQQRSSLDPLHPLIVAAGTDSFAAIGLPPGNGPLPCAPMSAAAIKSGADSWTTAAAALFGSSSLSLEERSNGCSAAWGAQYAEPTIDSAAQGR